MTYILALAVLAFLLPKETRTLVPVSDILGKMNGYSLSGSVDYSINILELKGASVVPLSLVLRHVAVRGLRDSQQSTWECPLVISTVTPRSSEREMLWKTPFGSSVLFRSASDETEVFAAQGLYTLRVNGEKMDIFDRRGIVYAYLKGELISITNPQFGRIYFDKKNVGETIVYHESSRKTSNVILRVRYDYLGRVQSFFEDNEKYIVEWLGADLISISALGAKRFVLITYQNHLEIGRAHV